MLNVDNKLKGFKYRKILDSWSYDELEWVTWVMGHGSWVIAFYLFAALIHPLCFVRNGSIVQNFLAFDSHILLMNHYKLLNTSALRLLVLQK